MKTPDISISCPLPEGVGKPYCVLLVEDNPTNQRLMRRLLENMNCHVDVASNGQEALGKLLSGRYEMIFMDCHMPVMDGYEATTEIRRQTSSSRLPIVAVTASIVREEHEQCRRVGMDQVITKPVDPEEIRAALSRWCRRNEAGSGSIQPPA